jgi:FAD/FMN-containing dehydrogenase
VQHFELVRSNGERRTCSRTENADWFRATIGGLGVTGLISKAAVQLRPVPGPWLETEARRFATLAEFVALAAESEKNFEYTVAWVDGAPTGRGAGRGVFFRGNHVPAQRVPPPPRTSRTLPFTPPLSLVNRLSLELFNRLYLALPRGQGRPHVEHYEKFFYPLDNLLQWNRLYGPRGFFQYQCVVPWSAGAAAVTELLREIAASGLGSPLTVLKTFGDLPPEGMLSFPLPGITLAMDFPNVGEGLTQLFTRLDRIVLQSGGRLYPAKDGRMSAEVFQSGYPAWREFAPFVDPGFSSSFWRRVREDKCAGS